MKKGTKVTVETIQDKPSKRRGAEYAGSVLFGMHADIVVGESIRLYGEHKYNANSEGTPVELTFKVGDNAVYGSYNLVYTGEITKITDKTIVVTEVHSFRDRETGEYVRNVGTAHHFNVYTFASKNRDYDADHISRHNHETMQYI